MEWLSQFVDFFIHLDHHMNQILEHFGSWTYLILFLIIFCETGLVITPFLPGDSLLFVVGAFAALGSLNLGLVLGLLTIAAILGDSVNYWIGHRLAPKVFSNQKIKFLNKKHLDQTQKFFDKYGGKTIIIARFVPIVRTFAPFLAGAGSMRYSSFIFYNIIGAVLWVGIAVLAGYFFGNLEFVRENFTLVIFAIIFISILPGLIEFLKHQRKV